MGEVANIVGGGTPSTSNEKYWDGNIDWYAPAEIGEQIYAFWSIRKITEEGLKHSSAKLLPAFKTVLFTSRAGIGNMAVLQKDGATNQGFQSIVCNDCLVPYFVFSMGFQIKKKAERVAAGSTFSEISGKQLCDLEIMVTTDKEQLKIGSYFQSLDHLITLHQRKLEKLKIIKKSMLENLFPKNGENTPRIRFSGFTEDWEQRKLGECFTERIESMPDGELISVTINDGVKKFSELGRHDNSNDDKSKYKKVCIGDIAYNSMRMWQGASGYSYYNGIVSPAYTVLSANYNVNSKFIAYQFKLPKMIHTFKINSQGITSDNWNLKFPVLSYIEIYISKQIEEQSKIAVFLESLDHLITLHQLEPYYLIFKAIAYRIIDYAEYKFFNVKINLIHDIL